MDVGRFLPLKPGNLELIELIRAEIGKRGPVSFAWFMEQALYQPQHGYYSSGRAAIGRSGDYFTNVSVGGLFGKLLAAQFAEMWNRLGQIDDFTIVEQGAHDGQFAHDVLQAIRESSGDFFSKVRYRMIEPITVLEKRQRTTLASFREKVGWCRSIGALEPFTGVHFSNELLDAMPVHLISRSALAAGSEPAGERWRERLVDWQNGGFIFTDGSITDPNLEAHVRRLPSLAAGYETEINLNVTDWL
ncbi:MAG: hypothetical protein JWO45_2188, partial [Spartobacteria bacterium]|nr:hypothetical protein [Spartobacteria bacterium]